MRPTRILIVLLEVVLALVASSALIRWVMTAYNGQEIEISHVFALRSASEAKFDDLIAKGAKATGNGAYDLALDRYEEAQRVMGRMSGSQYDTIQAKRQALADAAEKSGNTALTLAAYKALAGTAVRQGDGSLRAHQDDDALAKYVDAEGYVPHLTDTKNTVLLEARRGQVYANREKKDYAGAADASMRTIDTLEATGDAYDPRLTAAYLDLAQTYEDAKDWHNAEETLMTAWRECDKRIDYYSRIPGEESKVSAALSEKDLTLYGLIGVYQQADETDHALAIAEELYKFLTQNAKPGPEPGPYRRAQVARLAFTIAQKANRPADAVAWRARLTRPQ